MVVHVTWWGEEYWNKIKTAGSPDPRKSPLQIWLRSVGWLKRTTDKQMHGRADMRVWRAHFYLHLFNSTKTHEKN